MLVAKTIKQLEDAIRVSAQEIMIVGGKTPEILETLRRSTSNEYNDVLHSFVFRLNDNFNILEIVYNNHKTHTYCIRNRIRPNNQSFVRQQIWPRILRFDDYGDYDRIRGEVNKILAEITGKSHSLQEVAVNEALTNAMKCQDGLPNSHTATLRFNKIGNRLIVRVRIACMRFAGNAILRRLRFHPGEMFSFNDDETIWLGLPIMLSTSHLMLYNRERTELLLAWKLQAKD
jgi:hypothetical protein